jgi:hypothetical protein
MKQTTLIIDAEQLREAVLRLAKEVVRELTQNQKKKHVNKTEFHFALQKKLLELAPDFCCYGEKEHPVPNGRIDGRPDRIDVAWWSIADRQLVAVFEIDSTIRTKSLKKILASPCPYRFWIYYGRKGVREVIETLDTEKKITIIDFLVTFETRKKRQMLVPEEQITLDL